MPQTGEGASGDQAQRLQAAGIDAEAIISLWQAIDNPAFLRVAEVFIAELADRVARLPALLEGDDRAGLELQAHSIKGAASDVGAGAIHAAALRLEARSLTGSRDELAALATGLLAAAGPGAACLQALIDAARG